MNMSDREFLMWLHERLEHVHGEKPLVGYMHHLRAIIRGIPKDKETRQHDCLNDLDDLKRVFEEDERCYY